MKRIAITIVLFLIILFFDSVSNHCIDRALNKLFLIKINEYFDRTLLGEISLRTGEAHLYKIRFISRDANIKDTYKPLKDIVDIDTWKEIDSDNSNIQNFGDKNHSYELFSVEGSTYLIINDSLKLKM